MNELLPARSNFEFTLIRFGLAFVGCLLVASSFFHLSNPIQFLDAVLSYRIVDGNLAIWLTGILPLIQLLLGTWLICGFGSQSTILLTSLLLTVYCGVQLSALWRGLDIDCGCFGPMKTKIGAQSTAITVTMLTMCVYGSARLWFGKLQQELV